MLKKEIILISFLIICLGSICQNTTYAKIDFKSKKQCFFKRPIFSSQKNLKLKIKKIKTEDIIYESNFVINILDKNFKKLEFQTKLRGTRCVDCDVSKLKTIKPNEFEIEISKKYITLKIPIQTKYANMNSFVSRGYIFYDKKNYINITYVGKNHTYISDTIPLYVW